MIVRYFANRAPAL